jgi:hypothetical protein
LAEKKRKDAASENAKQGKLCPALKKYPPEAIIDQENLFYSQYLL